MSVRWQREWSPLHCILTVEQSPVIHYSPPHHAPWTYHHYSLRYFVSSYPSRSFPFCDSVLWRSPLFNHPSLSTCLATCPLQVSIRCSFLMFRYTIVGTCILRNRISTVNPWKWARFFVLSRTKVLSPIVPTQSRRSSYLLHISRQ